jgi:hypothetical protein
MNPQGGFPIHLNPQPLESLDPAYLQNYFQNSNIIIKKSNIFIDNKFFCGNIIQREKKAQEFPVSEGGER